MCRRGVACVGPRGDGLQPGLGGGDAHPHVHQLVADDLPLHQRRAKGLALARPGQGFVVASLSKPQRARRQAKTLGVEVAHDDLEAVALGADHVIDYTREDPWSRRAEFDARLAHQQEQARLEAQRRAEQAKADADQHGFDRWPQPDWHLHGEADGTWSVHPICDDKARDEPARQRAAELALQRLQQQLEADRATRQQLENARGEEQRAQQRLEQQRRDAQQQASRIEQRRHDEAEARARIETQQALERRRMAEREALRQANEIARAREEARRFEQQERRAGDEARREAQARWDADDDKRRADAEAWRKQQEERERHKAETRRVDEARREQDAWWKAEDDRRRNADRDWQLLDDKRQREVAWRAALDDAKARDQAQARADDERRHANEQQWRAAEEARAQLAEARRNADAARAALATIDAAISQVSLSRSNFGAAGNRLADDEALHLFEHADQAEGVAAFLEKRKPAWKNA